MFSDVNVIVAGKSFACHRVILAWRSDYFEKLFEENTSENVTLENVDLKLFEEILHFVDTNSLTIDVRSIKRLLKYSYKFGMKDLKLEFKRFIMEEYDKCSSCDWIDLCIMVSQLNDPDLIDKVAERTARFVSEFWNNDKFWKIPHVMFRSIISRRSAGCLFADDELMISTIAMWVKYNLDERKGYLQGLLELMDFSAVSPHI